MADRYDEQGDPQAFSFLTRPTNSANKGVPYVPLPVDEPLGETRENVRMVVRALAPLANSPYMLMTSLVR